MRKQFLHCLSLVFILLVRGNGLTTEEGLTTEDVLTTEDENLLTVECSKCRELVETGIRYLADGIGSISNVDSYSHCRER